MEQPAYQGKFLSLFREKAELPSGRRTELEVVRHPGAAAVVAVDSDGKAVLLRQWRHATGGWLLEVPAGKLDPKEAPDECARRELREETGYTAQRWTPLGWIWTTPGFTDEKIHLFLAEELRVESQALEEDEELVVEHVPLAVALDHALSGDLQDAKSICALVRANAALKARG